VNTQPRKSRYYAVVVFSALCLAAGWLVKTAVEGRTVRLVDAKSGVSLSYPASWLRLPEADAIVTVIDPQSPGPFSTSFTVRTGPLAGSQDPSNLAVQVSAERAHSLALYRTSSVEPVELSGVKGIRIEYAYAADPVGIAAGRTSIPRVARAVDVVVRRGDLAYYFTFAADDVAYAGVLPTFERILKSVTIHQGR